MQEKMIGTVAVWDFYENKLVFLQSYDDLSAMYSELSKIEAKYGTDERYGIDMDINGGTESFLKGRKKYRDSIAKNGMPSDVLS